MAYNLTERLPNAQLRIVNPAMHGLATEVPQVCSNLLRELVSGKQKSEPRITILNPAETPPPPQRSLSISSPAR
jgi:hypothetical protein